jgi:hypothetical protein
MSKALRKYALGIAGAAALFIFPISGFSQSIDVGPEASEFTTAVAEGVGNASNCGVPAKTRTR